MQHMALHASPFLSGLVMHLHFLTIPVAGWERGICSRWAADEIAGHPRPAVSPSQSQKWGWQREPPCTCLPPRPRGSGVGGDSVPREGKDRRSLEWRERPALTRKSPGRPASPGSEAAAAFLHASRLCLTSAWPPPAEWKGRKTAPSATLRARVAPFLSWGAPVPGKFTAVYAAQSNSTGRFWTPQAATTRRRCFAAQPLFFFAPGFPPCYFAPFPRSPFQLSSAQRLATTENARRPGVPRDGRLLPSSSRGKETRGAPGAPPPKRVWVGGGWEGALLRRAGRHFP